MSIRGLKEIGKALNDFAEDKGLMDFCRKHPEFNTGEVLAYILRVENNKEIVEEIKAVEEFLVIANLEFARGSEIALARLEVVQDFLRLIGEVPIVDLGK